MFVLNVSATALIARMTTSPLLISLSGPLIEKIGFFVAYIKEAFDIYSTTLKSKRKSIKNRLRLQTRSRNLQNYRHLS